MATVRDYTDPYISMYRRVPKVKAGVCEICHSAPNPGWSICYSCNLTRGAVTHPVQLIVPVSLYRVGDQLHHVLRNYKTPYATSLMKLQVASTLGRFLAGHRRCIEAEAGHPWEIVTNVPSSQNRPGVHPLELAIGLLPTVRADFRRVLEAGDEMVGHRHSSDRGFRTTTDVSGRAFVLVDDTFTTGGRLQSAASALTLAGGRVVAAVVIGRVIDPDFGASKPLWDEACATTYNFDVCCLE